MIGSGDVLDPTNDRGELSIGDSDAIDHFISGGRDQLKVSEDLNFAYVSNPLIARLVSGQWWRNWVVTRSEN